MIDITLLGTSALAPLPDRALTAVMLTCGGHRILFDCGEGTQTASRRVGANALNADIIALTHYHGDHIFGLPGLMQTMFSQNRTQPLTIVGPAGLEAAMKPILLLAGHLSYEVRLLELPREGARLNDIGNGWPDAARLTPFPTEHRVVSQGYAFTLGRAGKFLPERARALGVPVNLWSVLQKGEAVEADGRTVLPEEVLGAPRKGLKVVFSGDTTACPALEEAAREADLLICEGTYGQNEQADLALDHGHMNFAQAGQLAAAAKARRLWLCHYSQMIQDPEEYIGNARAFYPDAVCGCDGMTETLRFED